MEPLSLFKTAQLVCLQTLIDEHSKKRATEPVNNTKDVRSSDNTDGDTSLDKDLCGTDRNANSSEKAFAVSNHGSEGDKCGIDVSDIELSVNNGSFVSAVNLKDFYVTRQLETTWYTAVSEELLHRIVKHWPSFLTDRLLTALIPPSARELVLSNCENIGLMVLVDVFKK